MTTTGFRNGGEKTPGPRPVAPGASGPKPRVGTAWAVLAALLVAPAVASAQALPSLRPTPAAAPDLAEPLFSGVALVHDNDNLPHPGNTLRDDNYSAAYAVRISGRAVEQGQLAAPLEALDWVTHANRGHAGARWRFHSAQLVGLIYTPDRIDTAAVQRDDRPYASLVAVTVSRTSVGGPALDRAWSSELSIGLLGLDAPGDVQRLLHRTRRWMTGKRVPVDPLGWSNQISAGGEPTGLYRLVGQRRLAGHAGPSARKHWELVGALDGSVGYLTSAAGAASARLGAFSSEFWESPTGLASPAAGSPTRSRQPATRWDLYVFATARPRVVAYNALVQGQFRHSVFTVRPRRLQGEWEGGLGAALPIGVYRLQTVVQFAQGRTADFVGAKARTYTWGTVGLFLSRADGRAGPRE